MEINNLLRKLLSERNETGRGINYNDTYQVLNTAIQKCPTLKGAGVIRQMTQSTPEDDKKQPMITHFKEIYNMKPTGVAFTNIGNNIIVFGMVDPETSSGKRGLYSYTIGSGKSPEKMQGGAATGCPEIQRLEDYGQAPLSDYNEKILSGVISRSKGTIVKMDQEKPAGNYERVLVKDLTDPVTGQKLPWDGEPEGYVWKQTAAGDVGFSNNAEQVANIMKTQGFTSNQDDIKDNPELLELGFYLKDFKGDSAFTRIDPKLQNVPYWPIPGGGVIIDPTPEQCRTLVKELRACKNNDKSVTLAGCRKKLTQKKLSTIRCDKKGMFKAGGILGLKDDFEDLKSDSGDFGLARLMANLGKVQMMGESTLENRINKLLNEESRKFSFNKPKKPNYNFDQELIDELAYKAIVESMFNIQKAAPKLRSINENVFGDIAGAFGSNWMDKLAGAGKEYLASHVISMLGFDPNSYLALLFKNIFANLDFDQYDDFISNCTKFTKVIVKSALEAWLDYAWANNMKGGKDQVGSVVYMALKNMVTETAANTTAYAKLEKLAGNLVCPMITGIADSVKSGDINPLG